jgi:EAL domain-containing protein (putative c-di-GMP-specific phosphodiesterase class I)
METVDHLDSTHRLITNQPMKLERVIQISSVLHRKLAEITILRRLPAHLIKIDQTFIRDMLDDSDDFAIVTSVIALAKSFKRDVIAEGVETIAHGTALVELGCHLAQGYGIARPMPADQMPKWAADWQPDEAWLANA